ncbi:MAG: prolyl oligopeptidase family serine peptidase, partial [Actinomycetota bacterium]
GKDPVFSVDGRHVAFTIAVPHAELERAKKAKLKPEAMPKNGLGILRLADGRVETVDRVAGFSLPAGLRNGDRRLASPWLAYRLEAPKSEPTTGAATGAKKSAGTELVLRNLTTGARVTIPDVTEYAWNASGSWVTCLVDAEGEAQDGILARQPEAAESRWLLRGPGKSRRLTWDHAGERFAFLSDHDNPKAEPSIFKLYLWDASQPTARALALEPTLRTALMSPSENGALSFSRDGSRLYLGMAQPVATPKDAPTPLNVDLWHWKDGFLQTMQKVQADAERKHTFTAVVHLRDGRFVPLGSPGVPVVGRPDVGMAALGECRRPYQSLVSWDRSYRDVFLVNLHTGKSERVLEKASAEASLSPGGKYLLYYRDDQGEWYARRVSDGRVTSLTGALRVKFGDEEEDRPQFPDAYGVAGWTAEDGAVWIYDRYDIWEIRPDSGEARCLTGGVGRKRKLVFRHLRLDGEEPAIDSDRPVMLSVVDERTKASGFYRLQSSGGEPAKLVMLDKQVGGLVKSEGAERFLMRAQRFEEFPDLWSAGPDLQDLRKISDANPQQAKYCWGKSELIEYRNGDGKKLQAVLIRPDNFDPKRSYPLLVYIYEKQADRLHRYYPPAPGTSPNLARYVSSGYMVLLPDIVYRTGAPGESCYRCVIPAVQHVVRMGGVDPRRIGISGHSWGAYQASYLLTRTNLFRAAEAGASVANMTSAYGGIRWESGMSRAMQDEKGESRNGATPWENPKLYLENSPLFRVDRVTTPYLSVHNDADGAVPWQQGIEFFSALRRLGKEAYLFNYNGEGHGLRNRPAQKHWTVHLDEFFDHHLLERPRPAWMENGVPFLERGTRDVNSLFGKSAKAK